MHISMIRQKYLCLNNFKLMGRHFREGDEFVFSKVEEELYKTNKYFREYLVKSEANGLIVNITM